MAKVTIEIDPNQDPANYIFDIVFDCKARLIWSFSIPLRQIIASTSSIEWAGDKVPAPSQ